MADQPSPAELVASTLRVRFAAEEHEMGTPRTAAVVKGMILVGYYVWDAKVYTVSEACAEFGIKLSQTADEIERPKKHWPDCVTNHGGTVCDMGSDCGSEINPVDLVEAIQEHKDLGHGCGNPNCDACVAQGWL